MEIIVLLQSFANPVLDALALAITDLGSENAYIVMLLIVYLAIDARAGRLLGVALLGSYYLNQVLKEAFDTVRPYLVDPSLLRSQAAAATAPGPAFPSGHAQLAATFWGLVALLARRRWLTVLALVLMATIAATRLYLGVHWPIDVLAGLALGGLVVAWTVAATAWRPRPAPWIAAVAWTTLPLATHLAWPTEDSGMIAGALIGFATGPLVWRHRPAGAIWRRVTLVLLGLLLVFTWLLGTSVALPDVVKDHRLVAPLRYFVLAWMGVVVAPWSAQRIGLAPSARSASRRGPA